MKYYGKVGYSITTETAPDVWQNTIVEKFYSGDVIRNYLRNQEKQSSTVDDISISNQISIVADPFAYSHFSSIKYVEWLDQKWKVTGVEINHPRINLTIGGVWNGSSGQT